MMNASCSMCGNVSGYDKESLKGSTYKINGNSVVLCCPCEDGLKKKFVMNDRVFNHAVKSLTSDLIKWISDKKQEGWSIEVILDSMGQVEQDERHINNLG